MAGRVLSPTPLRFDAPKEGDHHLVVDIVDQLIVLLYLEVRQAGGLLFIERARRDHLFCDHLLLVVAIGNTYDTCLERCNFGVCGGVNELIATELSLNGQAVRQIDLVVLVLMLLTAGEYGCWGSLNCQAFRLLQLGTLLLLLLNFNSICSRYHYYLF